jgi:hypothetical protein
MMNIQKELGVPSHWRSKTGFCGASLGTHAERRKKEVKELEELHEASS